jgi:hypothetical protein
MRTLLVLFGLALGACGAGSGSCVISASDYDQSCTTPADCVAVFSGDICTGQCSCNNAFVNAGAASAYEAAFEKLSMPHDTTCPCSFGPAPACVNGLCVVSTD